MHCQLCAVNSFPHHLCDRSILGSENFSMSRPLTNTPHKIPSQATNKGFPKLVET